MGSNFVKEWKKVGRSSKMIQAQNHILNKQYMEPAISNATKDYLSPLGQYIYYDALVVHGDGMDTDSFEGNS